MIRFRHPIVIALVLAACIALWMSVQISRIGYETWVAKAVSEQSGKLTDQELSKGTPLQLKLASLAGRAGYEAAKLYPQQAKEVFLLIGHTPELAEVLTYYGPRQVIPVIYWYATTDSLELRTEAALGKAVNVVLQSARNRALPTLEAFKPDTLKPATRALLALMKIRQGGHAFLGRFVLADGMQGEMTAKRLYGHSTIGIASDVLIGEVMELERKYKQDKATWKDAGWAAADVALLFTGVKGLRAMRSAAVAGGGARRAAMTGARSSARLSARLLPRFLLRKTFTVAVIGGGAYLAIRYPEVFLSGLKQTMDLIGLPGTVFVFGAAFLMLSGFLIPIAWLTRAIFNSVRVSRWLLRLVVKPLHARLAVKAG